MREYDVDVALIAYKVTHPLEYDIKGYTEFLKGFDAGMWWRRIKAKVAKKAETPHNDNSELAA